MVSRSETPQVTIRSALPQERVAIRAARWPGLPPWAWAVETLQVAVAGRREFLLGCKWELTAPDFLHAGCAVSPGNRLSEAATEALIASVQPDPEKPVHWGQWLETGDLRLPLLERAGFLPRDRMLGYEVTREPATHDRFLHGIGLANRRMAAANLTWGHLDEAAYPAVRASTLEEDLMSAQELDLLYQSGEIDRGVSPVVWHQGKLAGFIVLMARDDFEILLMVVRPDLRKSGLGTLLIRQMMILKLGTVDSWKRIVFRGNPTKNPGSRHFCLRFGGRERPAALKLVLPPCPPSKQDS